MKIVVTSDLHGHLPNDIPECDLLLIGGDVTPVWNHDRRYQADWLRGDFSGWIRQQPARATIWIGGNHDFVLQDWKPDNENIKKLAGLYLRDNWLTMYPETWGADWHRDELKVWGSPWSNQFGSWAFMTEEPQLNDLYKQIPRDIDILITHGPPHGKGDLIPAYSYSMEKHGWDINTGGVHVGSTSLTNQLCYEEWPNLKLIITGHIHEAYGKYDLGGVTILNASRMDGAYNPVNPVMEIEL